LTGKNPAALIRGAPRGASGPNNVKTALEAGLATKHVEDVLAWPMQFEPDGPHSVVDPDASC
jgi:hypothetical protein